MTEQEINRKLAEWAGFKYVKHVVQVCGQPSERYEYHYPNGSFHFSSPNFTQSLDACEKYLFPKVIAEGYYITLEFPCPDLERDGFGRGVRAIIHRGVENYPTWGKTPAEAFCLAVLRFMEER